METELNTRQHMAEQERARKFWASLSFLQRHEIGDELVLGGLDRIRWFDGRRPSSTFLDTLDYERILWEQGGGE